MPRQTSRPPSTHDRQSVQDTVAEAIERDLTRVQARPMAVAYNTIAAGGSRDEMARLAGLSRGTLSRTVAIAGFPTPERLLTWIRLLLAAETLSITMPLQDGRLKALLENVNQHLFGPESGKVILPPHRAELLTYVSTPTGAHALNALSHGERTLLQMFARILSHMTLNTVPLDR
jgi:hypothetical protein